MIHFWGCIYISITNVHWKAKAWGSGAQPHRMFETSLGYMRFCFKTNIVLTYVHDSKTEHKVSKDTPPPKKITERKHWGSSPQPGGSPSSGLLLPSDTDTDMHCSVSLLTQVAHFLFLVLKGGMVHRCASARLSGEHLTSLSLLSAPFPQIHTRSKCLGSTG